MRRFLKIALVAGICIAYGFRAVDRNNPAPVLNQPSNTADDHESAQWEILFDGKNMDQWMSIYADNQPSTGWAIEDGSLCVKDHITGQDIITREKYGNFELVFEFNLTDKANSGIKYLVDNIKNTSTGKMDWNGPEYQIIDDVNNPDIKGPDHESSTTASLYLVYAPVNKTLHPVGSWNTGKIVVKGNHIEHWLNGVKVVDCERKSADFRQRMSKTKFTMYDHYGELAQGHIMLTDHAGDKCYFRNIKIRRL